MSDRPDPILGGLRTVEGRIRSGDFDQARSALHALHLAAPNDARVYLVAATLAQARGSVDEEIHALRRACALMPHWLAPQLQLAKTLSRVQQHEAARIAAERAVELAPDNLAALGVATAVANNMGDRATATQHLRSAFALQPDATPIRRALALSLSQQQLCNEAESHWRALLEQDPNDAHALLWLGICLIALERRDEALQALQHARNVGGSNPSLEFNLALAGGKTPPEQPNEIVRELFDGYAARFDQHLVGGLKYGVPRLVAQLIMQREGAVDVLDLGCGTGLLGVYLGIEHFAGTLVGVDLSQKMLDQAATHNVYRELRCADLRHELASADSAFDVVAANDVFVYVGDVTEIIPAAFRVLRPGGALIFSCETALPHEPALVLRASRRYAHSQDSIESLCRNAGFSSIAFTHLDLRHEANQPIAGYLAVAEKI